MLKDNLSPQERKVARQVAQGLQNKEVARELGIPLGTVKTHMRMVMLKVGARNRVEVALMVSRGEVAV